MGFPAVICQLQTILHLHWKGRAALILRSQFKLLCGCVASSAQCFTVCIWSVAADIFRVNNQYACLILTISRVPFNDKYEYTQFWFEVCNAQCSLNSAIVTIRHCCYRWTLRWSQLYNLLLTSGYVWKKRSSKGKCLHGFVLSKSVLNLRNYTVADMT